MASVAGTRRGQLMVQVKKVESFVANAQTLFLIATVLIRKYEDGSSAALTTTSALSFPTISIKQTTVPTTQPSQRSARLSVRRPKWLWKDTLHYCAVVSDLPEKMTRATYRANALARRLAATPRAGFLCR